MFVPAGMGSGGLVGSNSMELVFGFESFTGLSSVRVEEVCEESGEGSPGGRLDRDLGFANLAMPKVVHATFLGIFELAAREHAREKAQNLRIEGAQRGSLRFILEMWSLTPF